MIRRAFAVLGAAALIVAGALVRARGLSWLRLEPEPIRRDSSDWED